jgi:hypothetical protein
MIVPAWRSSQRSRAWLSVEGGADPGDLAAADAGDPEGFDEILDPAGADAGDVRFLDDGEERPLGPPARLEEAREVAAVADLGDREADRPHTGIPAPLAVPVAAREPSVGCPLAVGDSGQLGHLGLHRRLGEDPDPLAEEVGVALGPRLAQQVEHGHPVIGHHVLLLVVGLLSQRREDDAMADSFVGSLCCYTNCAVTRTLGT